MNAVITKATIIYINIKIYIPFMPHNKSYRITHFLLIRSQLCMKWAVILSPLYMLQCMLDEICHSAVLWWIQSLNILQDIQDLPNTNTAYNHTIHQDVVHTLISCSSKVSCTMNSFISCTIKKIDRFEKVLNRNCPVTNVTLCIDVPPKNFNPVQTVWPAADSAPTTGH